MRSEYIFMNLIAPAVILVPVCTAVARYRHITAGAKVLFVYLLFDALVSIASSALAYHHLPNTPLYHFATMVDTVLLLYFFKKILGLHRWAAVLQAAMILFPLIALLNLSFVQPLFTFNSYMLSLKSILVIGLCFIYWWQYESVPGKAWKDVPLHWIISGLLLYFSSAFILFTFSDFLISVSSKSIYILLWNIHASLSILMFLLLAVGFAKYKT